MADQSVSSLPNDSSGQSPTGEVGPAEPAAGVQAVDVPSSEESETSASVQPKPLDAISKLADRINMRPDSLREVIERLAKDSQVNLLWALYDLGSEET